MRAAVCRGFGEPLTIEEVELGAPLAGEVKVDIAYCAVCHSDVMYADGGWGGELPAVYGHEAAGVVSEVGAGVDGLEPGDRVIVSLLRSCGGCFFCERGQPVFCDGGEAGWGRDASPLLAADGSTITHGLRCAAFAEQAVVHRSQVERVPEAVPLDAASLLACGVVTGVGAVLNTAQVKPGSSVVVIGIGGVGINVVQGARIAGAGTVVAVDLVEEKLAVARHFGATASVNPSREDVGQVVGELTRGRGADYVFASAASARVMETAVTLCRRGGTAVLVGIPATGAEMRLDAVTVPDSGLRVVGSKMGDTHLARDLAMLCDRYLDGSLLLDELVSKRRPLAEINAAFDDVRSGSVLRTVVEL